jgi:putative colanic acid biosynthesis UDP-glucose lipid carrier transferase
MNNRFLNHLQITLVILDLVVINIVFLSCEYLFKRGLLIRTFIGYDSFLYFLNICWIIISWATGIYNAKNIVNFELFSRRSMNAFLYFIGFTMLYLYFFRQISISRSFIITVISGISVFLLANRFIYLLISQYFRKKEYFIKKIVVVGYNPLSKKLVHYLENDGINSQIIGFCEEEENVHEVTNYPILSNISHTLEECRHYGATEIYSTIAPEQNTALYDLISGAERNCIRFRLVPDLGVFMKKQLYIDYLEDMPVISLRKEPLEDLGNRIRRRLFDVFFSGLVLIFILSWMVPLIGLLILLDSRGPIFFVQPRSGKNNKTFPCIKFRTMVVNDQSDRKQATKGDSRITRLGRLLRRTSLDEFPQFFNVLRGDMSVVGPRPHMLKHTDDYSKLLDKFMVRQFVNPGITGWAQVNGFRGETKNLLQMERRVEHDIWYMENWSLWLDVRIIFLTIYNVIRGEENAL